RLMAHARERAVAAGLTKVDGRLRHGELVDSVSEIEPDARLFVLGQHPHATSTARVHLDHHLEGVVRAVKRPILVATCQTFAAPQQVVMAFDGSPTAHKMVETVARSPLLTGLPVVLVMAGAETPSALQALHAAQSVLATHGFAADSTCSEGAPEEVLPRFVHARQAALLVMGAYGHSRIRQLIIGSTTSTLLRLSEAPVLALR
ncbi:MAG TPA: universal stress protein, partial [Rubrivivax sp.]|nr:universal stress protein [Rubrivivax sp.]